MQRLLLAANAGDRQALARLLESHRRLIASIAGKYVRTLEDREDLTQEVINSAFENFTQLRDQKAFTGWIMGITANQGKNWLSRRVIKEKRVLPLDHPGFQERDVAQQPNPGACPEAQAVHHETAEYLKNILWKSCSGVEYNVIVRRWAEEEYAQIVAELAIENEATARSHYHRGIRSLWNCLLTEHREFLGGETAIQEAFAKAANAADLKERLTEEEKQAFQICAKSKPAFVSACMKLRKYLPVSIWLLLILRSMLYGQR